MSRRSRKRLIDAVAKVDVDVVAGGLFVTLTYPGDEALQSGYVMPSIRESKRDILVFGKRLARAYSDACGFWRVELQQRGAPHYHLLIFGVDELSIEWLSKSWYEVVGSGSRDHLLAGTQVQRIRSRNGVMYYAAKYIAKLSECDDRLTGRVWGYINKRRLDALSSCGVVMLDMEQWSRLHAEFVRVMAERNLDVSALPVITLYGVSAAEVLDMLGGKS